MDQNAGLRMFVSDTIKLDKMDGMNFTRWKEKVKFLLTAFRVYNDLEGPQMGILTEEEQRKHDQDETLCRGYILKKYTSEKEGADKFITFKFFEFLMEDNVSILDQVHEFIILVPKFKNFNIEIPKNYWLGPSLPSYHPLGTITEINRCALQNFFTLDQIQKHLRIEEETRIREKNLNGASSFKVNCVDSGKNNKGNDNKRKGTWNSSKDNKKDKKSFSKVVCYKCGEKGHIKRYCKNPKKKNQNSNKKDESANAVKQVDTTEITAMVSEMNIGMIQELHIASVTITNDDWWYDSGATTHVCNNRDLFKTYKETEDRHEVMIGDNHTSKVIGSGNVEIQFTSRKKLILMNVLHVPNIRNNLVSSDRGGEYFSTEFSSYCESQGLIHQRTAPYTPQQNGVVEKKNRVLQDMINVMLVSASLPKNLWDEALLITCHVGDNENNVVNKIPVLLNIEDAPKTYKEAITSRNSAFWKEAIDDEMDSLVSSNTWKLSDLPLVRITSIRVLFALASIYSLPIHQMDVKTAFLNGDLDEEVYMKKPEGFVLHGHENKMKDINEVDIILEIKVKRHSGGYALNQCHYIDKIINKFQHLNIEEANTSYESFCKLVENDGRAIAQIEYAIEIDLGIMWFVGVILGFNYSRLSESRVIVVSTAASGNNSTFGVFFVSMAILISSLDQSNPLHLHANDSNGTPLIRLNLAGVENYRVWASAMKLDIQTKNKMGFITGTCVRTDYDGSNLLVEQRDRCNAVVLSWILGSLPQDVYLCHIFFDNVVVVWKELQETYDRVYGSIVLPGCVFKARAELIDHSKLLKHMQFLMSLDDIYQPIRRSLLTREILPEVNEAFMIVVIDSVTNQNMTNSIKNIIHLVHISDLKLTVGHPNDIVAKITHIGNLRLNNNVVLFDVLVVPEYCDLKRERVLRNGSEFAGLYMFAVDCDNFDVSNQILVKSVIRQNKLDILFLISDHKSAFLGKLIHLDVWGPYKVVRREGCRCLCFAAVVKGSDKFSQRSEKCVLIGYVSGKKAAYKLFSLENISVLYSRDIKFYETMFPYKMSNNESVKEHTEVSTLIFFDHFESKHATKTPLSPNDAEEGSPGRDGSVHQRTTTDQPRHDEVHSATPIDEQNLFEGKVGINVEVRSFQNNLLNAIEEVGPRRSQRSSKLPAKLNEFVLIIKSNID
ncbi:zinc finger, CCHC-type containing protein [Tanacetum coccineum]